MRDQDHTVYLGFKGKMTKLKAPLGRVENPNFVITWKGMDWSGFRTLAECEAQFPELEKRADIENFAVVEK
jgi:hypothetical protein